MSVRPSPAEIARGENRQQVKAEIGRRTAMRHDRLRRLLEIVRRQPVVLRADKGLEEMPHATSGQPQVAFLVRGQSHGGRALGGRLMMRATIGEPHHNTMNGAANASRRGLSQSRGGRADGDDGCAPHRPEEIGKGQARQCLGLRRGRPFAADDAC